MGQAVEDMLEGVTCQECGEFMDDVLEGGETFVAPGYPRTCAGCEKPARRRKRRSS